MLRLLTAIVLPAAAILIVTILAPLRVQVVEAANNVVREVQVQTPTPTPTPLDWLWQSANLIAQLAPTDLSSAKTD
jgi:hypothetical protein